MSIHLLTGDDTQLIKDRINSLRLGTTEFNYFAYDWQEVNSALTCAMTPSFAGSQKVIVVFNCCFTSNVNLEDLSLIDGESVVLAFVAPSLDKRLKIVKQLLSVAILEEFPTISPWRTDLIAARIKDYSCSLGLKLDAECIDYLASAIGNDSTRMRSELEKLLLLDSIPTIADCQALVDSTNASALELSHAIRLGASSRTIELIGQLIEVGTHPLQIVATLRTQFRTWLWVKACISSGIKSDVEIAQKAKVNPNRIFFLKKEVKSLCTASLSRALAQLIDIECSLQSGTLHLLEALAYLSENFNH